MARSVLEAIGLGADCTEPEMLKRIILGKLPIFQGLLPKAEDCSLAIVELGSTLGVRARGKHVSPQQLIARAQT